MRSSFSLAIKCSRRRRRLSSSSSNKTNREPSQREANAPHKNSRSAPLLLALRSAAHRTASPTITFRIAVSVLSIESVEDSTRPERSACVSHDKKRVSAAMYSPWHMLLDTRA